MIEVRNLEMRFPGGVDGGEPVLRIERWEIPEGGQAVLTGPSGSGKTTLLHLLAGIRSPTRGNILIGGEEITSMGESSRDEWRGRAIGYIFQNYYLFPALTVLENTAMPLLFAGVPERERIECAKKMIERLDLGHQIAHYPHQLSTGERQRTVIARALVNRPRLILADEPSAHLDSARRRLLLTLLRELAAQNGSTLILATHDQNLAEMFPSRVEMAAFK